MSSVRVSLADVSATGCLEVFEYWDGLRNGRIAPSWSDFDLSRLSPNCIGYTHVVDIQEDPFDIVFRFWGTGLTRVLYFDRTGQSLLTTNMGYLDEDRRQQVLADYKEVIGAREPMPFLWDASSTKEYGSRLIVPSIRLPLSNDGQRVTNIVTHFDFASQSKKIWEEMFDVGNR